MPAPVNERTGDLPEVVARVLGQTVEAAVRALGDGLFSIVLFGRRFSKDAPRFGWR